MATNKIQDGDILTMTAAADITSGDFVVQGKIAGIALTSCLSGEEYQLDTRGVYEVPKLSGTTFAVGAVVYCKSDKTASSTASGNIFAGHAAFEGVNGELTVKVRLQSGV